MKGNIRNKTVNRVGYCQDSVMHTALDRTQGLCPSGSQQKIESVSDGSRELKERPGLRSAALFEGNSNGRLLFLSQIQRAKVAECLSLTKFYLGALFPTAP